MYDQLYRWENLLLAYRKAAKGKRGHANVAAFEHQLEDQLLLLQAELQAQRYQPGTYTSFYIHEPKRRKGLHYRRKFQRLLAAYRTGKIELATMSASVQGWINHVRFGNTLGLRRKLFAHHPIK